MSALPATVAPALARERPVAPRRSPAIRLSLTATAVAAGLIIVALADDRARTGRVGSSYPILWLGLLTIFLAGTVHSLRARGRTEGLLVAVLLGVGLYLVKVLDSPIHFTFHDEFSTLRVTQAALRLGEPFGHDPLITIHPFFPGLELVTAAVASLTGLSIFISGLIVIGLLRVLMTVALFCLFEAAGSWRVAAVASVFYAANPNFVFFNAQWAYESFSLPLAIAAVALIARAPWAQWRPDPREARRRISRGQVAVIAVVIGAVLVSHPMTSYALIVFLLAWSAIDTIMARRAGVARGRLLWLLALSALCFTVLWTVIVGRAAGGYFGPVFGKAGSAALNLLLGESAPKHLFAAPGVPPTPAIERLVALGSVGLALLILPLGLFRLRGQLTPLRVALAAAALVYIPSLPLRLTQAGTEISNRASEFVYIGIAFLAAVLATRDWGPWRPWGSRGARALTAVVVAAVAGTMFAGGIIIGWARYSRLPGPYEVVADERSVEPEGIAAAQWALRYLGRGNRIVVDRANGLLMGSIGDQNPQGGYISGRSVPEILTAPAVGPDVVYVLQHDRIAYVVADTRLAWGLPLVGVYVEPDEPGAYDHRQPPTRAALLKLNGVCAVSRVFDSGNINVFETRTVMPASCAASALVPQAPVPLRTAATAGAAVHARPAAAGRHTRPPAGRHRAR